jgi:hypothetical protein
VFQASEGGSVSVGRRKFQSKQSEQSEMRGTGATPTPAPQIKLEAAPRAIAGYGTERISRVGGGVTPLASPIVASREIVLSKTSLTGICLITFACGIVTTVMVDRARTRGNDRDMAGREPDPAPARIASAPEQAVPAPVAPAPIPPAPTLPPQAAAVAASASAAAEPVVVQMPNLETTRTTKLGSSLAIRGPALAASRPRLLAPAPAISAKSKPVVAPGPTPTPKTRPAPTVVAAATTKPAPAIVAPAKAKPAPVVVATATAKPTPLVVAPAKAKPTPLAAVIKPAPTKPAATKTKPATAAPLAAKAKPAGPSAAMSKKTKSSDPLGPPTEWVDPFSQ